MPPHFTLPQARSGARPPLDPWSLPGHPELIRPRCGREPPCPQAVPPQASTGRADRRPPLCTASSRRTTRRWRATGRSGYSSPSAPVTLGIGRVTVALSTPQHPPGLGHSPPDPAGSRRATAAGADSSTTLSLSAVHRRP